MRASRVIVASALALSFAIPAYAQEESTLKERNI